MKHYTPFFIAAILGTFLIFSSRQHAISKISDKPSTIYDTAVLMLKEFILEANDSNLGFKDFRELDQAELRVADSINIYYLIEDSLLQSKMPLDSHLVSMHRRIFPVYYKNQLRSSITFDITPYGWKPVIFDDADVIAPYIAEKLIPPKQNEGTHNYALIEAPFIHDEFIMEHDNTGEHILPSKHLKKELGAEYPNHGSTLNAVPLGETEFIDSLKHHMHNVEGQ